MSCEVKLLAIVEELSAVQEQFGLGAEENWLNAVSFSLSPIGDILAFGHGSLLIVLAAKWDESRRMNVYKAAWSEVLENPNLLITSVLCLPVASHDPSTTAFIAVGLDDGRMLVYSDSGTLIYAQQFQADPIQAIKAQSGKHVSEEVYIYHKSCAIIIDGSQMIGFLKTLKRQIARYGLGSPRVNESGDSIRGRKWVYKDQTVKDAVVVGQQRISTFDHYLTAAIQGGFFARYRQAPPQNTLIMATGSTPYIGLHYGTEGFVQPVLVDVARVVANKIKHAMPSWLVKPSTSQATKDPQLPAGEALTCRFGLCDSQRIGNSIWLAPNNKLAAVADQLGRVILVDCEKGIAVRVWKGYRDAQCGFVSVTEKLSKEAQNLRDRRKALFLVIFAPRRSLIEVWSLQTGPRVAAFSAAKNGQLVYNTHSYLGVTSSGDSVRYVGRGCAFFDPSDNSLKEISIPFHCALSDANSNMAKDLHMLKRLKICLKSVSESDVEEFEEQVEIVKSFVTEEIKLQCVEMLVKHKKITPKLLHSAMEVLLAPADEQSNEGEEESKSHLKIQCDNYRKLSEFYLFLTSDPVGSDLTAQLEETPSVDRSEVSSEQDESSIFSTESSFQQKPTKVSAGLELDGNVKLTELELRSIGGLIEMTSISDPVEGSSTTTRVTFEETTAKANTFQEYLSYFNASNDGLILIKEDSQSVYSSLGKIIFEDLYQNTGGKLVGFTEAAESLGVIPEDLLKLFLAYWVGLKFTYRRMEVLIEDLNKFNRVLRRISLLAKDKLQFENNSICLWWQNTREYLLESACALRGLLAALMCRNEALKYAEEQQQGETEEEAKEVHTFETLSQEAVQWGLLIGMLEDVAVLAAVIAEPLICPHAKFPCLKYEKPDVSLKEILKGGKGVISEMVAKWIAASGIKPDKLVIEVPEEAIESEQVAGPKPESSHRKEQRRLQEIKQNLMQADEYSGSTDSKQDQVLCNLNILRRHFPFSLESGTLLCHLAWEYIGTWTRDMCTMKYLTAGLVCLNAIPRLSYFLKHGLCCMIWNAHLKIPLVATKKLVDKVGRLPKEKFCMQDIGISSAMVPQFLEGCLEFFDAFAKSLDHDKLELRFEELLQEGRVPLVTLAAQQTAANMVLLKLHQELTHVLLIVTSFHLGCQKPIQQLFDGMTNQAFFAEINRPLGHALPKPDSILTKGRIQFLKTTISHSMELIREDTVNIYYAEHTLWMTRIETLCEYWEINVVELKKHQILELYANGWDTFAGELLENIVSDQALGSLLLTVAGRRLLKFMHENTRNWANVAGAGSLLTDYLDTLVGADRRGPDIRFPDGNEAISTEGIVNVEKLSKLIEKAYNCLSTVQTANPLASDPAASVATHPTTTKELRVAGVLFDACAIIRSMR